MKEPSNLRTSCLVAGGLLVVALVVVVGALGAAVAFGLGRGRGGPWSTSPPIPTATEPENFPEAPEPLPTGISVASRSEPYVVTGTTGSEIRADLNRLGPPTEGRRWDAMTNWYVRWSYPFDRSLGRCETGPVSVSVTITTTLPNWSRPVDAPSELVERWERYETALAHHEEGHKNHGLLAARDVLEQIRRLEGRATCAEMDRVANEAGQRVLTGYRDKDRDYDRRTRHGMTQGAVFP